MGLGLARTAAQDPSVPSFQIDKSWPAPLPNDWILGGPASVAVDRHDHVWILHRPAMAPADAIKSGKRIAPPVLELDPAGNVLQAWGGAAAGYDWPQENLGDYPRGSPGEHGIFVDADDNVWITGNGDVVLKFSKAGKFLLQIGEKFRTGGSNDPKLLGNPTDAVVDVAAREVYVSDGYLNRRIVVFDSETGRYKRHWGAYGNKPDDGVPVNLRARQAAADTILHRPLRSALERRPGVRLRPAAESRPGVSEGRHVHRRSARRW